MIEIKRILCPVDFSDHSRRALDHAVAIARWYESAITVLYVCPPLPVAPYNVPIMIEPSPLTEVDRGRVLQEVQAFIRSASVPDIPIDSVVTEGNATMEILGQAAAMKADLLVLGTHGRSGFDRVLLGSVTEKLLRKATCPVLTVPRRQADAVPASPVLYKRIVCPVDFSPSSLRALNYAMSLAQEADAELVVVHVLPPESDFLRMVSDEFADARASLAAVERQQEEQLRQQLQQAVPDTVKMYCRVESMMVRGKPSREILRIAAEQSADLIVMGVQGRGGADLMFFGSTTQHVVREAACPVLTLRRG